MNLCFLGYYVKQIRINGEWSKKQRNKKIFKVLGWDIYTKRSFGSNIYKAGKKVTWIQESRFQESYMGCTHSGKDQTLLKLHFFILKSNESLNPSVRQDLISWTLAMQAT